MGAFLVACFVQFFVIFLSDCVVMFAALILVVCFFFLLLFVSCGCFFTVLIYFLLQLSLWYFVAFALVVLGICLYNVWPPSEYSKAQRLQIEEPYEDSSSEAESIIVPTSS